MVLLGEDPSPFQLTGIGLVIGGLAIAVLPFRRLWAQVRATAE
jgi:drug/metabolite transporter (DMT)-like permease